MLGVVFVAVTLLSQGVPVLCSVCTDPAQESTCVTLMNEVFYNRSIFWFGTDFLPRCPVFPSFQIRCNSVIPPVAEGYSLADLLFDNGTLDTSQVTKYIQVTYTSPPGSYIGCRHNYTESETVISELDPLELDMTIEPWYLREAPQVGWDANPNTYYTLFLVNAAFGIIHLAWMNIPGNDTTASEVEILLEYTGPLNYRQIPSPYVFLLFEQRQGLMSVEQSWVNVITSGTGGFELGNLTASDEMDLEGPVGLSWFMAFYDAYAIQTLNDNDFSVMHCVPYVRDELDSHNRTFLPDLSQMAVFVDINPVSPERTYEFCCQRYEFVADTLELDPIGSESFPAIQVQTGTPMDVTLTENKLFPDPAVDFANKLYTILAVDPDLPQTLQSLGTESLPFLHWLHINVPVNSTGKLDFSTGLSLLPYQGPLPPDNEPHTYYFMVLEQTNGQLNLTDQRIYTGNCSTDQSFRCLFDVRTFVDDEGLSLVGATWLRAEVDDWVRMQYNMPESTVCAGRDGYDDPCPLDGGAAHIVTSSIIVLIGMALLNIWI